LFIPITEGYRYLGDVENGWLSTGGERGALKSMVTSRLQPARQKHVRFVQCCGRQKTRNASNGIGGDFPLQTK